MDISDDVQYQAREQLLHAGGRVRFTGSKPYRALQAYARSLDVAVLPYRRREPTYSGSSTRFYEHLAACRPMLATRGSEELLQKEPLLKLFNNSQELVSELKQLAAQGFRGRKGGIALAGQHSRHLEHSRQGSHPIAGHASIQSVSVPGTRLL